VGLHFGLHLDVENLQRFLGCNIYRELKALHSIKSENNRVNARSSKLIIRREEINVGNRIRVQKDTFTARSRWYIVCVYMNPDPLNKLKRYCKFWIQPTSVPDPKLIISDPDPQIENREFRIRIRILDPDPFVN